jgi:CHASE2 domain-containing sensor protein
MKHVTISWNLGLSAILVSTACALVAQWWLQSVPLFCASIAFEFSIGLFARARPC